MPAKSNQSDYFVEYEDFEDEARQLSLLSGDLYGFNEETYETTLALEYSEEETVPILGSPFVGLKYEISPSYNLDRRTKDLQI